MTIPARSLQAAAIACPACGTVDDWRPLVDYPPYAACRCGMVGNPAPDLPETYEAHYFTGADGKTGHRDFESAWAARYDETRFGRELAELEGRVPEGRRLLDIGCATGSYLRLARSRGWNVTGVEVSDHAAELARRQGIDVFADVTAAAEKAPYDVVTLHHVLEHLTDPVATLTAIRAVATPAATLLVEVPNFDSNERRASGPDWMDLRPDQHRWQFAPQTLPRVLRRAGWSTNAVLTPGEPLPSPGSLLLSLGVRRAWFDRAKRSAPPTAFRAGSNDRQRGGRAMYTVVRAAASAADRLNSARLRGKRLVVLARPLG